MSRLPTSAIIDWGREGLRPPPKLKVWEWADIHRQLPPTSAEQGKYRSSRVPYWREVVEFFDPECPYQELVVMKGARIGASVSLAENVIGYFIEHDPCPIILVRPTIKDAEENSKLRLEPMFESTPALRELLGAEGETVKKKGPQRRGRRRKKQTIKTKTYRGGAFYTIGANSKTDMRGKDGRILIGDEIDAYPLETGDEGDPWRLLLVRSRTFPNRKAAMFSTPAVKGRSRIEKAYLASTMGRFHLPCPRCGAYQALKWGDRDRPGGVKWDAVQNGVPVNVHYQCEHCFGAIYDHEKEWMLDRRELVHEHPDRLALGVHISGLYSTLNFTWHQAVCEFLAAGDDPAMLKVFVNTVLAETWDEDARSRPANDDALDLRERWWGDGDEVLVPSGAGVLTAGVDTQDDRLEVVVRAWGVGEEAWTVDRKILWGDTSAPAVWDDLDRLLMGTYAHACGGRLGIAAAALDTGGHRPNEVLRFCESRHGRKVWAVKGDARRPQPWPRRPTRPKKSPCPLYVVGVNGIKEREYSRLRAALRLHHAGKPRNGAGMVHFPDAEWCDEEYFAQLTSEVRRVKQSGGKWVEEWHLPNGRRNEVLDCHVYSYAALHGLLLLGVKVEAAVEAANAGPAKEEAEAAPAKVVGFKQGRGVVGFRGRRA